MQLCLTSVEPSNHHEVNLAVLKAFARQTIPGHLLDTYSSFDGDTEELVVALEISSLGCRLGAHYRLRLGDACI
jgi:hypothetical protein